MRLIDADAANIYLNSTGVEMIKDMPGINLPDGYDINRLKELIKADAEGRCAILPCKGNTVYHIDFDLLSGNPPEVFESTFKLSDYEELGKTVFLTLEEVDKMLKAIYAAQVAMEVWLK